MSWQKEGKQEFDLWESVEYCKMLQKRWGTYEEFENTPIEKRKRARQPIIDALRATINLKFKQPIDILEVGCGCGNWLWIIREYAKRLIGLDSSEMMLSITHEELNKRGVEVEVIKGTCWKIPLEDNSVDFSFQIDVCMHVGGSWESIKEMLRVTRQVVLFTGPSFESWKQVMNYKVRKLADHGMYWGVSHILLDKELSELQQQGKIAGWYYLPREVTEIYKHRILVVER